MPTPRQHPNHAARQQAYRERQEQARRQALQAKGLPATPTLPTLPGTARWQALREQARQALSTLRDEMQAYHDQRREAWQESERGEAMRDWIEACDELLTAVDDLLQS
jgi:hypothetical protein